MGPQSRRSRKRRRLLEIQEALIRAGCWDLSNNMIATLVKNEMECSTPQQTIAQARHERRVLGHDVTPDCGCTPKKIDALVAWNQPDDLWTGGGHRLHRRLRNRRGRNR